MKNWPAFWPRIPAERYGAESGAESGARSGAKKRRKKAAQKIPVGYRLRICYTEPVKYF
jgi:hypothetical protein